MTCKPGLELLFHALGFAADQHRDGRRKDGNTSPYINHPIAVAGELVEARIEDPEILAAALLHDTLEDTSATSEDLEREFGPRVRRLVEELTDDKTLAWDERKRRQVEHARQLEADAKLIKIADKISNVRDVAHRPPTRWSVERRRDYIDWSEEVVAGCRGVSRRLEDRYDEVLTDARQRLDADAAGKDTA